MADTQYASLQPVNEWTADIVKQAIVQAINSLVTTASDHNTVVDWASIKLTCGNTGISVSATPIQTAQANAGPTPTEQPTA